VVPFLENFQLDIRLFGKSKINKSWKILNYFNWKIKRASLLQKGKRFFGVEATTRSEIGKNTKN
jgi:hypothetical protein